MLQKIASEDFLNKLAIFCLQKNNAVIIVPESQHIYAVKQSIIQNVQGVIEMPKIISLQNISNSEDEHFLSRNFTFAWFLNEIKKNYPNIAEPATFARSIIGEIPSLYLANVNPQDLKTNILAKISESREINVYLFADLWQKFEDFLLRTNQKPYYKKQKILLNRLLQSNNQFIILDDFGRSPLIKHCCSVLQNATQEHYYFCHSGVAKKKIYNVQNSAFEINDISSTVQHLLGKNSEAKIGIICENDTHAQQIAFYLKQKNIECAGCPSIAIEGNSFLHFFCILTGKYNLQNIVGILQISDEQKKEVLKDIVNKASESVIIKNISMFLKKQNSFEDVINFVIQNKKWLNREDFGVFLRFCNFLRNELKEIEGGGIAVCNELVNHILSSWKNFEHGNNSFIKICQLRHAYMQNFDAIILTSSYKTEQSSNVIFSVGMRHFFNCILHNDIKLLLNAISCNIYHTSQVIEIEKSIATSFKNLQNILNPYKVQRYKYKTQQELPQKISATALETLLENPVNYFFKYEKKLKPIEYTQQFSLDIGNAVHDFLKIVGDKIQNRENYDVLPLMIQIFHEKNLEYMVIFYENFVKKEVEQIKQIAISGKVSCEEKFEYILQLQGKNVIISATADRIDIVNGTVIINDYKTGKYKNAEIKSAIKNFKKIQCTIPSLNFKDNKCTGRYIFCTTQDEFSYEVDEIYKDNFQETTKDCLKGYFIDRGEISGKKSRYEHLVRTF